MSAVLIGCAYGLFLAVPVFVSFLIVSVMKPSVLSLLIPLGVLAASSYFLPFGLGNPHVSRLVRSLNPSAGKEEDGFIVQLTVSPRIRSGVRALLEDADDIGYLKRTPSGLVFQGDSINLWIPFDQIKQVQRRTIGLRGLFICGPRVNLIVPALPNIKSLQFAERSSSLLPGSRATTEKLLHCLKARLDENPKSE